MNLKWSFGNSKLKKNGIVGFAIPAFKSKDGFVTCAMAGTCASYCFARMGFFVMSNVQNAYEHNLAIIRKSIPEFTKNAIEDLKEIKAETIRVHVAGDFLNQQYLDAWYSIARTFPNKVFYAYTKMLNLDLWTNQPSNFKIIQSEGGLLDHKIDFNKPHSKVFTTHYQRRKAGYLNGSQTENHAIKGTVRIGLRFHGTRKLTKAQTSYLNKKALLTQ